MKRSLCLSFYWSSRYTCSLSFSISCDTLTHTGIFIPTCVYVRIGWFDDKKLTIKMKRAGKIKYLLWRDRESVKNLLTQHDVNQQWRLVRDRERRKWSQ